MSSYFEQAETITARLAVGGGCRQQAEKLVVFGAAQACVHQLIFS
jgi:hypothetical protein